MKKTTLFLLLILGACHSKENAKPVQHLSEMRKVTYSITLIPTSKNSSPIQKLIWQENSPSERTVYWNGKQSSSREINNEMDFKSEAITIRDMAKSIYVKPLQFFCYSNEFEETEAMKSQPDIVKLLPETKTILGHLCKKATIEMEYKNYTIWYAADIQTQDPTKGVLQFKSIPGFIMEMDEKSTSGNLPFYTKYTVTSLSSVANDASVFETPKDAIAIKQGEEPIDVNWNLVQKAMLAENAKNPISATNKAAFLGTWLLKINQDYIKINIAEKPGTADLLFAETYCYNGKSEEIETKTAVFFGNKLLVKNPAPNYSLYTIVKGKLKMDRSDFALEKIK